MKFQKVICLIMLIVGAIGLLYAFFYCSGALAELGQNFKTVGKNQVSVFTAEKGKYDATLYTNIQGFNNILMFCGLAMVLLAVVLYITSCNKRRNYYASNYVATGLCAGGNIIISVAMIIMNTIWRGRFLNVDFDAWRQYYVDTETVLQAPVEWHYSESTAWFDVGYAVYAIIIVASVFLLLNLIWKIKLMQGEKQLLEKSEKILAGGEEA